MTINELWLKRSDSEKVLMMLILPALLLALVQFAYILPVENSIKQLEQQKISTQQNIDKLTEETQQLEAELRKRSLAGLQQQQKSLSAALDLEKSQIDELTSHLIPPQLMPRVIEKVLEKKGKLQLLSISNLPLIPLMPPTKVQPQDASKNTLKDKKQQTPAKKEKPLLYRHPVEIKLSGRYFEVVDYLKALETSGYKFYWEELDYHVLKYPMAEVAIKLSTLGTEPQWMGASDVKP
ncbi:MAG: hypothetical protein COW84_07570 [Gammaproteobacteria bacterium CG22_combo_CG10-13_8_21_14_all_40_8]|nr:MAG: hypothetical protein COW84_07570 [Gammaproteobacteria bacterium CG22_combo_CG10-13_8_21_14_all_40_8]